VIDAGGRFSIVARKAGAQTVEEHHDLPTTVYYAYWSHAEPYDESGRPVVHVHTRGNGFGFLLMDGADGQLGVGIYGQSALLARREEKVEEEYTRLLREEPRVWRRLRTARRVTSVRGMRDIANRYRTPGGPGWALVGDALHHVDPMSAQGIYDALAGARALSQALAEWKRGAVSWQQAIVHYGATIEAETRPHYAATLARIRREIFTLRPDWAWKSYVRWVADDPSYKRRQALTMARGVEATNWLTPGLLARAILRGAVADLARSATGKPRPNALPPLRSGHLAASTLPLMLQCDP
jgi:flavin-dependent dehydrogenase